MARLSVLLLLGLCLPRPTIAPNRLPGRQRRQVQQTVDRAIGYLQTEKRLVAEDARCAACHHVPMPLWALSEAGQQGYTIDKRYLSDTTSPCWA